VLHFALAHPEKEADMLTTSGSPNHGLWSLLVKRGWMTGETWDPGLKPAAGVVLLEFWRFRLKPEGRQAIIRLLAEFDRRT
jgi:hypothetical protein